MKKRPSQITVLNEISELIRSGQGLQASTRLKEIKTRRLVDPKERLLYASLSRRLNLPQLGLTLLHPVIRPSGKKLSIATDGEKVEYAALLIRIGAIHEGLNLLKALPAKSNPFIYLFEAFAYMSQWDYQTANGFLTKFIDSKEISHYDRLVATANLCEGLVYQMDPTAEATIHDALIEAKKHNYTLVYGHIQMTRANYAIQKAKWNEAEEALKEAEKCFLKSETIEDLFIRKWRAILHFKKEKGKNKAELHLVRDEAITKWKHWETVRDCEYVEAIVTKNKSLYHRLYFGTPYDSFHSKLRDKWGEDSDALPEKYEWDLNRKGKSSLPLELFSGNGDDRKKLLESRKQVGELLSILISDFYRPFRLVSLHDKLFPDSYYNPQSSTYRVRAVIFQTREWLKREKYPLRIILEDGLYRLTSTKPVTLVIPNQTFDMKDATSQKSDLLKSILKDKSTFSLGDAVNALNMSRRSACRLLQQAVQKGILKRVGKSRSTTYEWVVSAE